MLYVANTGKNEVRRYTLGAHGATLTGTIGSLGSGDAHFAGPMAIAVGRHDGVNDDDVYVADAHNQRVVHLRDAGSSLAWMGAEPHGLGLITSLDADHFGNVYAAAPQAGRITKFTSALTPVASFAGGIETSDATSTWCSRTSPTIAPVARRAPDKAAVCWSKNGAAANGIRLLNLGVDMTDAAALDRETAPCAITLTDHADVSADIVDPANGRVIAHHEAGQLDAGTQTIRFSEKDYVATWSEGDVSRGHVARARLTTTARPARSKCRSRCRGSGGAGHAAAPGAAR